MHRALFLIELEFKNTYIYIYWSFSCTGHREGIDINKILNNHITSMHSNTSSEDRNAIKRLQERKDIVIKPADKGGAIVVWRRDLYFQEALRQISNTVFYYPIENDSTPHQQDIITATAAELISQKSLPNSATNLIQDNPKCSTFCLKYIK